ncbi:MAG TPA: choice-of-anchor tandem repeat GloVer-containing protein [Candidatus Aquilonibacter sp.]|nr:choice-of-anchor tandem repeat GloVer-containing protein [Candidatus Aquilonibacter sp.]
MSATLTQTKSSSSLHAMVKGFFPIAIFKLFLTVSMPLMAQTFTTLHNFSNTDGQFPTAGLVLASNVLYGTTSQSGSQSNGTVFAMNIDGSNFRVLHSFTATDPVTGTNWDGAFPSAGLVLWNSDFWRQSRLRHSVQFATSFVQFATSFDFRNYL